MANIKVVGGDTYQFGGFSPFGNSTVLRFGYDTNRIGAVIGSDTKTAVAAGDKIYVAVAHDYDGDTATGRVSVRHG